MMEEKFRKYINGKADSKEVNSVISNLLDDDKTEESEKLLSSYWQECMSKKTIKPHRKEFISGIHKLLGTDQNLKNRFNFYKVTTYVAATLLLAFILGSVFYFQRQEDTPNHMITQTIDTPYGARTNFELPDGSKIWLNSGSTISFPVEFSNNRVVQLTGEAFFDVKKTGTSFKVETALGNIEVLGTSFNVNAYDEELFQTTLVTGKVKIYDNEEIDLNPSYQYYRNKNNKGRVIRVDTDLYTSWKDGVLIFRNEPFKEVIKKLERWYNVKIYLKDESLKDLRYTGTIRMESFSEVLEVLEVTSSIKYSFNEETRIITIAKAHN